MQSFDEKPQSKQLQKMDLRSGQYCRNVRPSKNTMVNIVGMTHGFSTARGGQDRKKDPDDAPKKGVVNIIGIKWSA